MNAHCGKQPHIEICICLFTCLTTRAVHLECIENLSAGTFLRCLQRFVARRGVPNSIRSDQGRNFLLAERVLLYLDEVDESIGSSVNSYMANERIKWIFNPPISPWMGGICERLVQSVKRAYNKMIGRRKISIAEMTTVIAMIEAILNTRPIKVKVIRNINISSLKQ
uniref:Integrase catalytic domain-containing protein n=1 Tax=Heterorhabditis bacteriophora TaxID=37862 RepID=A0A1I7WGZ8_HETBA